MGYKTKEWRDSMRVTLDYNNMTEKFLGDKGFSPKKLTSYNAAAAAAFNYVKENRGRDDLYMGWTELPYNQKEIVADIAATARNVRRKFQYFVVLGIGGSALGPIMAFNALCHLHYNDLPKSVRKGPKFYVEDNVDPVRMRDLLDVIDPAKTCFNVISKSGATSETMTQYLIILDLLKKAGVSVRDNVIFTTDAAKGNLKKISDEEGGIKSYVLPDGVGGRFSQLCPVGLLPAAVLGIDINGLLAGAAYMDNVCRYPSPAKNPALMCAVLQVAAMEQGKNVGVMMPYSDNLKYLADWYCQLWAESLGKNVTLDGKPCNVGQTPVKSLGVTDQHSQVQLYTEGPFDKVITMIAVEKFRRDVVIPSDPDIDACEFLKGHTMGELLNHERVATEYALRKAGRMNFTVTLPEVNEETVGELLAYYMYETAFAGAYLGVDTFNQPGVEEGKKATFAMLGRKGYEEKLAEVRSARKKDEYRI